MNITPASNATQAELLIEPVNIEYASTPLANGMFFMHPSGDIVDLEERNRRLKKFLGIEETP